MLWNAHNTTRRLYSKYEKQIFLALAFFTFVKAYTRENGFASGTSDAKPFFTRNSVSCEALLPAAEPARFRRERTGAAALAKHFSAMAGALRTGPLSNPWVRAAVKALQAAGNRYRQAGRGRKLPP